MSIQSMGIVGRGKLGSVLEAILPRIFPGVDLMISTRTNDVTIEMVSQCDLVIPAVPISAFHEVLKEIAQHIRSGSIVMDVCAVKQYPVDVINELLPSDVSIVASHPMFGPGTLEKTHGSLQSLKWVMYPVRLKSPIFENFVLNFSKQGIDVISLTPQEHDKYAAAFHFTAHVTAAILKEVGLERTPIDTRSAESLFEFMEMVHTDSPSLLKEMMKYNPYCKTQLEKLHKAQNNIISLLIQS